ncbi:MAG: HAD family hydrolase [Ruminococcus sp.]|nr:HAD family hydrolase [Ruminococcus sp.]
MQHILFDLDGTLLPMKQDAFVKSYFTLLGVEFVKLGIDPQQFKLALFKGVEAMVTNDGSCTNETAFWNTFTSIVPGDLDLFQEKTMHFYETEFNKVIEATQPTEWAAKIISLVKAKGLNVYLATNPLFPQIATAQRIRWAGLNAEDFLDITTYEHCHYCKPNVEYFRELIEKHHLDPKECLMVGNDVDEDLVISKLGVKTYLITNTMENKKNLPITADYTGTLEDFYSFIQKL